MTLLSSSPVLSFIFIIKRPKKDKGREVTERNGLLSEEEEDPVHFHDDDPLMLARREDDLDRVTSRCRRVLCACTHA